MHKKNKINIFVLIIVGILTLVTLIFSSYAWFSSTLDVEITEFRMYVDSKHGLSISLDGINWGEYVDVDVDSIINNLSSLYPNHTNQWSKKLTSVSTVGLRSINDSKFTLYSNQTKLFSKISYDNTDTIRVTELNELSPNPDAEFIAFDVFLRNTNGSPYSDNLYINSDSVIKNLERSHSDDTALNSMRIGFVFYDTVSSKSNISTIQSANCRYKCDQLIYEPFIYEHNNKSINVLSAHGVSIENGVAYPTYALKNAGDRVNMWAGVLDSGIDFSEYYFDYQNTFNDLSKPIYKLYDGITKVRIYIWIEAQDIDIIEQSSDGYLVSVMLKFEKDMASYEQ